MAYTFVQCEATEVGVIVTGKGFGHGVGMAQQGDAYGNRIYLARNFGFLLQGPHLRFGE